MWCLPSLPSKLNCGAPARRLLRCAARAGARTSKILPKFCDATATDALSADARRGARACGSSLGIVVMVHGDDIGLVRASRAGGGDAH